MVPGALPARRAFSLSAIGGRDGARLQGEIVLKGLNGRILLAAGVSIVLLTLSACASKPAPPVAPPPVVVIPPQPQPPRGASPNLVVPPVDATGVRQTINVGASQAQTIWNLRAAYNVAALNCLQPQHAAILDGYKAFLKAHTKTLNAANKSVDREFKERHGASFIRPREAYMTQVYNYFAFPPTLPAFCDAALVMSNEVQTVKSADLDDFSMRHLPAIDRVFDEFFRSYEQYRADLAAWRARYAAAAPTIYVPPAPAATPGVAPTVR